MDEQGLEGLVNVIEPPQLMVDVHSKEVMQYPRQVYYQRIEPQTYTEQSTSWYVESPGEGYLLDAFATVAYDVYVKRIPLAGAGAAAGTDIRSSFVKNAEAGLGCSNVEKVAFRQNFPIARSIRNCTLTLNGQNLSTRPFEYQDAMNRMFLSHEDSETFATMSAGYYDKGSYANVSDSMNSGVGGGNPVDFRQFGMSQGVDILTTNYGYGETYTNDGYGRRLQKMLDAGRTAVNVASLSAEQQANAASNTKLGEGAVNDGYFRTTLHEPVPISPFAFYPSMGLDKSIPNVRRFTLQYDYVNLSASMLQVYDAANVASDFRVYFGVPGAAGGAPANLVKPILHLRWYRPAYVIPPSVSIDYTHIQSFRHPVNIAALAATSNATIDGRAYRGASQSGGLSYNNIRLEKLPDLFMIYFKPNADQCDNQDPSDHNLAISDLQISIEGVSGRVLNANSVQLYRMWLTNAPSGTKSTYEEWLKHHCVVALTPTDLGVQDTDIVRQNRPMTMNIDSITATNFWCHPPGGSFGVTGGAGELGPTRSIGDDRTSADAGGAWLLYVQAIYFNRKLSLTSAGSASLSL